MLRFEGDHVRSRGLVSVSRSVDLHVGQSPQPSDSLDRLVGGTVLTQTDRVVSGNVEHSEVRQGGESDGTGGVGDEVEESGTEGDDTTVGGETVADGGHLKARREHVSKGILRTTKSQPGYSLRAP